MDEGISIQIARSQLHHPVFTKQPTQENQTAYTSGRLTTSRAGWQVGCCKAYQIKKIGALKAPLQSVAY
jgi:hypothetical protein